MESTIHLDHQHARQPSSTPVQHKYGTRTRQNSVMRPSARLRQSPEALPCQPRKIKPAGPLKPAATPDSRATMLKFPPDNVVLHREDATSKVFQAIGRSLMAIDNRAVTIKDLAEMTVKYGIGSQNVSAASQAITTYIRTHMRRCDEEQDQPLLLRHILSGTPSDDELLPALHSRAGGAHCGPGLAENRLTNFRKGTVVWYLSKAAGAPCPFARVGIRVCDYTENGKTGPQVAPKDPRERRRERDRARRAAQCGEKRKRLARACVSKGTDTDSDSDHEGPPPKVKLTLRLKPSVTLSTGSPVSDDLFTEPPDAPFASSQFATCYTSGDSEDDSMTLDSSEDDDDDNGLCEEEIDSASAPLASADPGACVNRVAPTAQPVGIALRRSPSIPHSIASAPPDSEEEDEDFHISMTGPCRASCGEFGFSDEDSEWPFDFDADDDADDDATDTTWGESPATLSPPPLPTEEAIIKVEQTDVRGMLDAWDDLDKRVADAKMVELVARATAEVFTAGPAKTESDPFSMLQWEEHGYPSPGWEADVEEDDVDVKQEDADVRRWSPEVLQRCTTSPIAGFASMSLQSPVQEPPPTFGGDRRPSLLTWQDVELKGPDSVHPKEFEDEDWPLVCNHRTSPDTEPTAKDRPVAPSPHSAHSGELRDSIWGDFTSSLATSSSPMTPSDSPVVPSSTVNHFLEPVRAVAREFGPTLVTSGKSKVMTAEIPTSIELSDGPAKLSSKCDSNSSLRTIVPQPLASTPWEEDSISLAQVEEDLQLAHAPFPKIDMLSTSPAALSLDSPLDTPLSPTEQEMFRSLCVFSEEPAAEPKEHVAPSTSALVASKNDDDVEVAGASDPVPNRKLRRSTRLAGARQPARPATRGSSSSKRSSK